MGVCVMPHTTLCGCMNAPLLLPLLSSATFTLWALPSSSAHIPTPLACLLCVCVPCGLCSVGLSADISISHMFISAATPTRFVPPPPSPLPVQSGTSGDFSPLAALSCCTLSPATMAGLWGALLKHERLLVAVFCAFSLCTVDCSPPSPSPFALCLAHNK